MKKFINMLGVLSFLIVCLPAEGEILIYRKNIKCWDAVEDDGQWSVIDEKGRGFLVLDIEYDEEGAIDNIAYAYEYEYGRNSEGVRVYSSTEHEFDVVRVQDGNVVAWVLVITTLSGDGGQIMLLRGNASNFRIGNDDPNEVARGLEGGILNYSPDEGADVLDMCQWELRLHQGWTKRANRDAFTIYDALDFVEIWLDLRRYSPE